MSTVYPTTDLICYDLEVFPGWFLAGFRFPNGDVRQYEIDAGDSFGHLLRLRNLLTWLDTSPYTLAGFNSIGYDDPVLSEFLHTGHPDSAYETSKSIIVGGTPFWKFRNQVNSIDLMQILPGRIGLKKIGVCLGHSKLQELPIPFDKTPTHEDRATIKGYNINDLRITRKLLEAIQPELDLRAVMSERYGVDLRSKGEATLAELAILEEYKRVRNAKGLPAKTKKQLNKEATAVVDKEPLVRVSQPSWWKEVRSSGNPSVAKVCDLAETIFATPISLVDGRLKPGVLDRRIFLGDRYYKLGVGGLHSVDGPGCWLPGKNEVLENWDVTSYYPNIILTQQLAPRQWGDDFLPIYKDIVDRRIEAKREGDKVTASILKISANGTYGKSSDPYSSLYDPQLTVNVTVLGQISLLILIAMLDGAATVCSANTDGILILAEKNNLEQAHELANRWESITGFELEYDDVSAYYQKDVNNFIQVNDKGKIKAKGRFVADWPDLRHTPNANIVAIALRNFIKDEKPIRDTLYECRDINQFILTQSLTGGYTSSWNGRSLGKVLRFYKSNRPDAAPILRTPGPTDKGNEGTVANSENCVPLEDLPGEFPVNMNYGWYLGEVEKLWESISRPKRRGMNVWAEFLHNLDLRPCPVDPNAKSPSRAAVKYGEVDFSSIPPGFVLGTGTGDGLLARVNGTDTTILKVAESYPTKTREKVRKDHGFVQYYGPRVPLSGYYEIVEDAEKHLDLDACYTDSELKKVGR